MADQQLLFQALSDFARTLVLRYAVPDVLFSLTDHITDVLGVAGAGVSLADEDRKLRFITASNETITEIERVQELAQHGACVEAFQSGVVVHSDDLTTETRWSELVPDALRLGLRSVAAIPMRLADETIGSVNVYDVRQRQWPEDDIQAARLLADMAVSYVTNASALERSERVREQLQEALESRVVIEQAKGMVAAAHEVGVDEAFKRLRAYARARHAGVHDVAAAVVNLGLRID
jgi:GAF domain-containing protein